jgi:formylglycine-generating enzyme required for sulfatase activity
VGKDWFVNGEGQTFAVVRGPVEFTLGSPPTEPNRFHFEIAHRKRISRTFAIATKEVTVAEFLRFRPDHEWVKRYSPGPDTPALAMTWYEAAEYCNWLSEREGIPSDQWCYEPNVQNRYGEGMRMKAGYLKLTGYRIPTEAEWEFACRGGTVTSRSYGRGVELLPRYGWYMRNADDRAWEVGALRPNELGLFDTLGNATEWCGDGAQVYETDRTDDTEVVELLQIDERLSRRIRGGAFSSRADTMRSACRNYDRPGVRTVTTGFRPVRTLQN